MSIVWKKRKKMKKNNNTLKFIKCSHHARARNKHLGCSIQLSIYNMVEYSHYNEDSCSHEANRVTNSSPFLSARNLKHAKGEACAHSTPDTHTLVKFFVCMDVFIVELQPLQSFMAFCPFHANFAVRLGAFSAPSVSVRHKAKGKHKRQP